MYNDLVKMYAYYGTPLWWIFYLYFAGRHQLLLSLSGPLDSPYSVEPWYIGAFGSHVKLNICQMTGLTMEW